MLQIVRKDRTLEQIVFPVPHVCEYLLSESKERVLQCTECNEQGSKVCTRQPSVSYIYICQYIHVGKRVVLNILHLKIIRVENVSLRVHLLVENKETEPLVVSLSPTGSSLHSGHTACSPFSAKSIQYNVARQMATWSSIAFYLAFTINLLVALFNPFDQGSKSLANW